MFGEDFYLHALSNVQIHLIWMVWQLKQNGWIGNFALGASYICLPWYSILLLYSFAVLTGKTKYFALQIMVLWILCYMFDCVYSLNILYYLHTWLSQSYGKLSLLYPFFDRWAGQALFGTLTPDVAVLTVLYSIAGVCFLYIFHGDIHYSNNVPKKMLMKKVNP